MPEIRPVTKDNWRALVNLEVHEAQRGFVVSNLYSIAESQFGFDYEGHWDYHAFGIYEGDTPVGFLMYALNLVRPTRQVFITRLMVDRNFQGKGYGKFGMQKMLEIFRAEERIKEVCISYEPHNETARKLYAGFGFVESGEMAGDEILAALKLR